MENNQNKNTSLFPIIATILIIIFSFFLFQSYSKINDLERSLSDKEKQISSLGNTISNLRQDLFSANSLIEKNKAQIKFMDKYVAICPVDGSGLYHKYNCSKFKADAFYIYNIDQASSEGFSPCYECSELDNTIVNKEKSEIVYITETGSKYHKSYCSYLKSKKPITKKEAINKGYSACSRCNP